MTKVFITGANKSIGLEATRQLIQRGQYVYLGSRDLQKGVEAVNKLKAEGLTNVEAVQIDVSDPASVHAAYKTLSAKTDRLDVLINNAGISGSFPQAPTSTSLATFREVFETNFFSVIGVTQMFLPLLQKSMQPRIVNVTSGLASLALHNDPSWQFYAFKSAAYGPSKTALNAYTIALAYELRTTPFKVNAVDPGYTATDFNHHSGTGTVEDAARRVVTCALIGADGPTGKFFSEDNDPTTGESPW